MKKEVEKFVGAKHKKEEQGLGHSLRNLLCALTSKINSLFLEVKYKSTGIFRWTTETPTDPDSESKEGYINKKSTEFLQCFFVLPNLDLNQGPSD